MGLFSKKHTHTTSYTNRYASHPDVLDAMAKKLADLALYHIKQNISRLREPKLHIGLCTWSIYTDAKEFERYYGTVRDGYAVEFKDYGMENVPDEHDILFFSAILPYLTKHLKEKLNSYFPEAYDVTAKNTYYREEHKYDEEYDTINVIEIEVRGARDPNYKPEPTYKKW